MFNKRIVTLRCSYLLFQGVDPQLAPLLLLTDGLHLVGETADLLTVNLSLSAVVTAHLQCLKMCIFDQFTRNLPFHILLFNLIQ